MKDIQFNRSMSKEMWETLHATEINTEDFSVRSYNAIRRAGYETMGELVDSTESELRQALQQVKRIDMYGLERTIQEITDKIAVMGFVLPTDEEKCDIVNSLTETEQLQREINLLNQKLEKLEKDNASLKRENASLREDRKVTGNKALLEAREIASGENAVAKILERMQFEGSDGGYVSFCNAFALREKYCVFDDCAVCSFSEEELQTACQKCIDKFLKAHYKA